MKVRVRFAPSPTGPLHIGGVRTALYNYLFAKQHQGDLLLRIEDTDRTRFVPKAEEYIIESLKWLGITFDEGVGIGGEYGPYRQSERKKLYAQYAQQLIDNGWAYYAFDTQEELEAKRKDYEKEKKTFQYDCTTRQSMTNSLTLSKEETAQRLEAGEHYVIRFKFPENEEVCLTDLIRGEVKMRTSLLDDKVLFKSDGMPTYHLANIVDDHLMKITHVIRGEEWLPSTPLHVMLYRAFGWQDTMPQFAHLPLLLKPEGNGKLSKRDGDRLGFPVFPLQWQDPKSGEISSGYRESGYLPQAVINMLAFLGWNPGGEREIFSLEELVKEFSIERISKSGAKFSLDKAKWFNHQYLQMLSDKELAGQFMQELHQRGIDTTLDYTEKVVAMIKERCSFAKELWDQSHFFFEAPTTYEPKAVQKRWKEGTSARLQEVIAILEKQTPFDTQRVEEAVHSYIESNELNMGQIMNSLRLALVGETKGPSLFAIIDLIGTKEAIKRINKAIEVIKL